MPRFATLASRLTPALIGLSLWSGLAGAQSPARPLLRQLYGDLAFDIRTAEAGGGAIILGVADGKRSITVTVLAPDLRRWSDSLTKVLAARPPRRGQSARWDVTVAGPGLAAGTMALSRSVAPGDTSIALLVTDTDFMAVRTDLTLAEARALASAMKRAAALALAPPGKPPR
jgi:hypothetical protein